MEKVLIVGVSSLIGSHLAKALSQEYEVEGTFASHPIHIPQVHCFSFPLKPKIHLSPLIQKDYAAIIYCSAITDFQLSEQLQELSYWINAEIPYQLATRLPDTRFIFFSSTKIFLGDKGFYNERDAACPQGIYGETKFQAEEKLKNRSNVFILRLGTAYGIGEDFQRSMFNKILRTIKSKKSESFIHDEFRSFISTGQINTVIKSMLKAPENLGGIYHVGGPGKESYYSFVKKLGEVLKISTDHHRPISGKEFDTKDPLRAGSAGKDLTLDCTKLQTQLGVEFETLEKEFIKMV